MDRGYDYKKYSILFVDDEEQALKYFAKAFWKDFEIVTAPNAEKAMEVLQQQGEKIGVLITDQRMPGQTGVDLLNKVRHSRPDIVRIITTAYTDLDSAIESVNSGAVFRYVTKPWNIRELRGVLLRAMEFFLLQRERDMLLREKLSVLQRMIILDRVRSFTVLAASLAFRVRNSMTALKAFFDLVPAGVGGSSFSGTDSYTDDLWTLAQRESQRIVHAVDEVLHSTIESDYSFSSVVALGDLIQKQVDRVSPALAQRGVTVDLVIAPDLPAIKADVRMINRLLEILTQRLSMLVGHEGGIHVLAKQGGAVYGASAVHITMTTTGPDWTSEQIASLFSAMCPDPAGNEAMGIDVLAAFFIAHHHGGELQVHASGPQGPGFDLVLPVDPEATHRPALEANWLDRIFTNLEAWDHPD